MTDGPLAHVTELLRAARPAILVVFILACLVVSPGIAENPGGASVANRRVLPTTSARPAAAAMRRNSANVCARVRN